MDAFELWYWRVPWTSRRSNPLILNPLIFIGRTDAEAEAPMIWPPDAKTDSLETTLMLRKIEGRRRG